jgi:IS5 family transposase
LFAAEERGAKLDKLGEVLQLLEKRLDFVSLVVGIDRAARVRSDEALIPAH